MGIFSSFFPVENVRALSFIFFPFFGKHNPIEDMLHQKFTRLDTYLELMMNIGMLSKVAREGIDALLLWKSNVNSL